MGKENYFGALARCLLVAIGCIALLGCSPTGADSVSVEYRRTGGFAAFADHLVIETNRTSTLTRHDQTSEFIVNQSLYNELITALNDADFTSLTGEYKPADTCCDLIEYTITYGDHTVQTMDTAIPNSLQPVIELLNQIIASAGDS